MKRLLVFLLAIVAISNAVYAQEMESIVIGQYADDSLDSRLFREEIYERQQKNPNALFEVSHAFYENYASSKSSFKDDHLYKNQNIYILIGLGNSEKDKQILQSDWNAIFSIMSYLSRQQMRVIINVSATAEHLRLAAESDSTAAIIWSSHGNKDELTDFNGERVPYDVFRKKSKNFYQFIVSTCYGKLALENYHTDGLYVKAWSGLTTSKDLENYLLSDAWSPLNGKPLTRVVNELTCTVDGDVFKAMLASNRRLINSVTFSSLDSCYRAIDKTK